MTANAIFIIVFFFVIAVVLGGTAAFVGLKILAWRRNPQAFEENLRRETAENLMRQRRLKETEKERIRAGKASLPGMFFGFLMLGFGLVVLFFAVRGGCDLARAQIWEKADCTVLEISAERHSSTKGGTTFTPKILYEYEFAGTKYTGNRFAAVSSSFEADEIGDALKPFRRGAKFTCFVNPQLPSESVAGRSVFQYPIWRYLFGLLICFGLAALILSNSLPRWRKKF